MNKDDKRVIAHPDDEAAARRYADRHQLPLQLEGYVPRGSVYVVDPLALPFEGEAPVARVVGICSRCATDVLLTDKGASCACGSMRIPRSFFGAESRTSPC